MRFKKRVNFQINEANFQYDNENVSLLISLFMIKIPLNFIQLVPDFAIKLNLNV